MNQSPDWKLVYSCFHVLMWRFTLEADIHVVLFSLLQSAAQTSFWSSFLWNTEKHIRHFLQDTAAAYRLNRSTDLFTASVNISEVFRAHQPHQLDVAQDFWRIQDFQLRLCQVSGKYFVCESTSEVCFRLLPLELFQ